MWIGDRFTNSIVVSSLQQTTEYKQDLMYLLSTRRKSVCAIPPISFSLYLSLSSVMLRLRLEFVFKITLAGKFNGNNRLLKLNLLASPFRNNQCAAEFHIICFTNMQLLLYPGRVFRLARRHRPIMVAISE